MNDGSLPDAPVPDAPVPDAFPAGACDLLELARFDEAGLVPAIAQQWDTREVLMVAWMNREALELTLATGRATYFSRSRQQLWEKGETSGHRQRVHSVSLDCDGDTVLLMVDQVDGACHTGDRTCFDQVRVEVGAP